MHQGHFFAILAYGLWGIVPLYWKLLEEVPPEEILAHRVIWSCLFFLALLAFRRMIPQLKESLQSPLKLKGLGLSSILIGVNWFIYIFAITNHRVLEASLGYFISPLVYVVLGMVFLGERLSRLRWGAVGLATAGVLVLSTTTSSFPWIAFALATTFALYGLIRKRLAAKALIATTIEAFLLVPLCLVYLFFLHQKGAAVTATAPSVFSPLLILLAFGGVVTGLPLLFFAEAARRIPFATLGFIQYLSPSLQFLLAVWVFKESFSKEQAISFTLIWFSLLVFSADAFFQRMPRKVKAA